jgi:hypothetical protein
MEKRKSEHMKMRLLKGLVIGLITLLFSFPASSQTLELGVFGGGSYYLGELNPSLHFNQTQLAYGILARLNFNPRWAIKASYSRGKVKGDDNDNALIENNGLNFVSTINDISVVAEFNFLEYFTGSKRNSFTPFIFGGVGFFTFNPKSQDGVALQPLGTEGQNEGFDGRSPYNRWGVSIPFGFGLKWSVSKRVGLAFEWGMRKAFTDYIDDVSTTFYLPGESINPEIDAQYYSDPTMTHDPYMQRGNEKTWDWFNYTGVTVTYKINLRSRLKCNLEGW